MCYKDLSENKNNKNKPHFSNVINHAYSSKLIVANVLASGPVGEYGIRMSSITNYAWATIQAIQNFYSDFLHFAFSIYVIGSRFFSGCIINCESSRNMMPILFKDKVFL